MRLFGSERVMSMLDKMGMDDDTPIDQKMLSGAIESAQKKVESRNFQIRKNVLQYDDVLNTQREVIYKQRQDALDGADLKESILSMIDSVIETTVHGVLGEKTYLGRRADVDGRSQALLGTVPDAGGSAALPMRNWMIWRRRLSSKKFARLAHAVYSGEGRGCHAEYHA